MPITKEELAVRLKAARKARGLKQQEVADYLGVSRPTLTQMELGNRSVGSTELQQIAYLYGRDIRDLLAEQFKEDTATAALFRIHPEIAEQDQVLRGVRDCLELGRELTNLECLLEIDREIGSLPTYPVRSPKNKWDAIKQGRRIAYEERRRLGLGAGPLASVTEVLENQGIRTAQVDLPDDISGMTLVDRDVGIFVVANKIHPYERRRFSCAHEYAHALLDRDQQGVVSRTVDRDKLIEVRANTFAATFLMPEDGVRRSIQSLGKGSPSRMQAEVFDGEESVMVRKRPAANSQEIQLYDVAQIAHHFGCSRIASLYRLLNLKLITEAQLERLKPQDEEHGEEVARLLALPRPDDRGESNEFRHRFLGLGMEALRRGEITRAKLYNLSAMIDVRSEEVDRSLEGMGLDMDEGDDEVLLP